MGCPKCVSLSSVTLSRTKDCRTDPVCPCLSLFLFFLPFSSSFISSSGFLSYSDLSCLLSFVNREQNEAMCPPVH